MEFVAVYEDQQDPVKTGIDLLDELDQVVLLGDAAVDRAVGGRRLDCQKAVRDPEVGCLGRAGEKTEGGCRQGGGLHRVARSLDHRGVLEVSRW